MFSKTFRIPVAFGEAGTGKKKRKKTVVLMLDRIRDKAKLTAANDKEVLSDKKTKNGEHRRLKGDRDNSVRVWLGETTSKKNKKYISVPYPAGATIRQINAFVAKIKDAKTFTMPTGQTYSVSK